MKDEAGRAKARVNVLPVLRSAAEAAGSSCKARLGGLNEAAKAAFV